MNRVGIAHNNIPQHTTQTTTQTALLTLTKSLSNLLGFTPVWSGNSLPYGYEDLDKAITYANTLVESGILASYRPSISRPDEPQYHSWTAVHAKVNEAAGGSAVENNEDALMAMVGEALERYIWKAETDYFRGTRTSPYSDIQSKALSPKRFAGHSDDQRAKSPRLKMHEEKPLKWIRGHSWVTNKKIFVPAQVVSLPYAQQITQDNSEGLIREIITTGLATGRTKYDALAGGALEAIERDAFMIMWLNQLTLPRIAHDDPLFLAERDLQTLLARCKRYNLEVHFVHLLTDAPTYTIAAIVIDPRNTPPFAIGTAAHQNPARAAVKGLLEALRGRHSSRYYKEQRERDPHRKMRAKVDHLLYWSDPSTAKRLAFSYKGPIQKLERKPWLCESPREHFDRLVRWCTEMNYECVSVDVGISSANVLKWPMYFVIIPELQPLNHEHEYPCASGERLARVPKHFGYTPRKEPYAEQQHPFF